MPSLEVDNSKKKCSLLPNCLNVIKNQQGKNQQNDRVSSRDKDLINEKIIKILSLERQQIESFLKEQFQVFIKRIQRSVPNTKRFQQCYESLSMFLKASFHMISVYFPILSTSDFVSLQYQAEILNRVYEFKNSIFKSFRCLCSKIQLSIDEKKKSKNKMQESQSRAKKGTNSKTPIQNSVVLTQWLLKNFNNPYPSNEEKEKLSLQSGLSVTQVNNWFINSRQRVIKRYTKKEGKESMKDKKTNMK